jgi:hypothetical protein
VVKGVSREEALGLKEFGGALAVHLGHGGFKGRSRRG